MSETCKEHQFYSWRILVQIVGFCQKLLIWLLNGKLNRVQYQTLLHIS